MRDGLYDARSAKFRNVRAVVESDDWHSLNYAVFICGDISARNAFGAHAGWDHFVVEYDQKTQQVGVLMQTLEAEASYLAHCRVWRDARHISERSEEYVRALTSAK